MPVQTRLSSQVQTKTTRHGSTYKNLGNSVELFQSRLLKLHNCLLRDLMCWVLEWSSVQYLWDIAATSDTVCVAISMATTDKLARTQQTCRCLGVSCERVVDEMLEAALCDFGEFVAEVNVALHDILEIESWIPLAWNLVSLHRHC